MFGSIPLTITEETLPVDTCTIVLDCVIVSDNVSAVWFAPSGSPQVIEFIPL